jgi:hypothetical protein
MRKKYSKNVPINIIFIAAVPGYTSPSRRDQLTIKPK